MFNLFSGMRVNQGSRVWLNTDCRRKQELFTRQSFDDGLHGVGGRRTQKPFESVDAQVLFAQRLPELPVRLVGHSLLVEKIADAVFLSRGFPAGEIITRNSGKNKKPAFETSSSDINLMTIVSIPILASSFFRSLSVIAPFEQETKLANCTKFGIYCVGTAGVFSRSFVYYALANRHLLLIQSRWRLGAERRTHGHLATRSGLPGSADCSA